MTWAWAASAPRASADELAACRHFPGLEVAEFGSTVWIRGRDRSMLTSVGLRAIAGIEMFELDASEQLTPVGKRLSVGRLPEAEWRPLQAEVLPRMPTAGFAGRTFRPARMELERSSRERDANVLMTRGELLRTLVDTMPQARLERWMLAVRNDGQALIRGPALPPADGLRFWEQAGVAVPVGFEPSPTVPAAAIAAYFQIERGDLLLWTHDGIEHLHADQFVRATRAAIRASCRETPP